MKEGENKEEEEGGGVGVGGVNKRTATPSGLPSPPPTKACLMTTPKKAAKIAAEDSVWCVCVCVLLTVSALHWGQCGSTVSGEAGDGRGTTRWRRKKKRREMRHDRERETRICRKQKKSNHQASRENTS